MSREFDQGALMWYCLLLRMETEAMASQKAVAIERTDTANGCGARIRGRVSFGLFSRKMVSVSSVEVMHKSSGST
jgi:hypothetical protein